MRQGTIVTVPTVGHPVSLAEAKRQLRIDECDLYQDGFIEDLIAAAHGAVEQELGFPIMAQTRQTHLRGFPADGGPVWLGRGAGLTVGSVAYLDSAGASQTLAGANYIVDAVSVPATIAPAPSASWPATQDRAGAVVVTWSAGWADAASVPAALRHAMKLLIGHWFENREAVVVGAISTEMQLAVEMLLDPWRRQVFF